jgi:hypothetical protein
MSRLNENMHNSKFHFRGIREAIQPFLESNDERQRERYGELIGVLEQLVVDHGHEPYFVAFMNELNASEHPLRGIRDADHLRQLIRRHQRRVQPHVHQGQVVLPPGLQNFFDALNRPDTQRNQRSERAARHSERVSERVAEAEAEDAAAAEDVAVAAAAAAEDEARAARPRIKFHFRNRSSSPHGHDGGKKKSHKKSHKKGGKKSHKKGGKKSHKKSHRRH